MTPSPARLSVSSFPPTGLTTAQILNGRACPRIWRMVFDPTTSLAAYRRMHWIYSPAWDAQLFEWTQDAISKGFRGQVREEFQILTFVQDGLITGPGGRNFGSSGFSINCTIVQRLD